MKEEPPDDPFVNEVRRQVERTRRSRELTFWQGLGLVGAIGWMVCLPAVLGALLGRWLDGRLAGGIFWTLILLVLGLALGCVSAWRHMNRDFKG
jgi:ATP synthase protein I